MIEIERKFLVDYDAYVLAMGDKLQRNTPSNYIEQGYILISDEGSVRIRKSEGEGAILTVKRKVSDLIRVEFELPVDWNKATDILKNESVANVSKFRHLVMVGSHLWEVDIFQGSNKGLVIAEIELKSEDEQFELPSWVTKEVSYDHRYLNQNLGLRPYSLWRSDHA